MNESINENDLMSYINEELIGNNAEKEELNDEIYSKYVKTENFDKNSIGLTEKNKLDLAQAALLSSLTNNVYNQTFPLSPPQDDVNSSNNEIYLNSQNIPSNNLNSPSMELEALSPSSMGSEVNDITTEEQNLMNLTQLYQNNSLISSDNLIDPGLLSQLSTNSDFLNNNALLNAMCTGENNKSQLFPQVLPNSNVAVSSAYINDALNPLSAVNISIPTNNNIPVTLNTGMSLPTITVPSNMKFTVPSNDLNLNNDMTTDTTDIDLTALQSLSSLAMNGPLVVDNSNPTPSSLMDTISSIATSTTTTAANKTSIPSVVTNATTGSTMSSSSVSSATAKASNSSLSETLDLASLKSSVSETLQLTKKLSQNNSLDTTSTIKEEKPNIIDVTDILKSDVAASCLNLLKGSKGKPGRKKKCLQASSDSNNSSTSNTNSISSSSIDNKFPYLNLLNKGTEGTSINANTNIKTLQANSVKFPIIKPKIGPASTNDSHTPILPIAPATTKSNSISCFNGPLLAKSPSAKPSILPTPILPNGSTDKSNNNNNNKVKTAYQKRQERLLKNREAAHLSRKRKREQLHMLETHAQELIAENQTLKLKVIELEQLNEKLLKENELLKTNLKEKENKGINDLSVKIKKEITDIPEMTEINTNALSNDIYNLYIKSEVNTNSCNTSSTQNKSSTKGKEIGIVFMVILFSFSIFTFPLSIFTGKSNNDNSHSLISSFMNRFNDFSLASISSDNAGKILSGGYEKEKPFLLDSGSYEFTGTEGNHGELEIRSMDRKRNGKSRKIKNTNSNDKSKRKHNTTHRNIKKNYEYTSYNEISSLMSVFHPKNVNLDDDSLKQMTLLQHWIVEGFCSIHENHTYAKDPSNVKDIIKIYNDDNKNEGSTDLTVKKNVHEYYDSSKTFAKDIPWNMKQFIKFYPDTTYFYSPKLVQLFPLSVNDILEPSIPIINRLQPNDTAEVQETNNNKETNVSPSSRYSSSTYSNKKSNESEMEENIHRNNHSASKSESQDDDNVYHLPFTNKPKMAIITNIESDDIDEESNSYLMIDFEIKGARLIENE
jgi:hypothetical protein